MVQEECMEVVRGAMAELLREKKELVARLNAMTQRIEEEKHLVPKVLLKIAWMEEKQRSVTLMNKMAAALQGVLEADTPSGEQPRAASSKGVRKQGAASEGVLCRGKGIRKQGVSGRGFLRRDGASSSSSSDADAGSASSSLPRHPNAFSGAVIVHKHSASSVHRIQIELFAVTMANMAQGFIRECSPFVSSANVLARPPLSKPRASLESPLAKPRASRGSPLAKSRALGVEDGSSSNVLARSPLAKSPLAKSRALEDRAPVPVSAHVGSWIWKVERLDGGVVLGFRV